MGGPTWLTGIFAALMLTVAYCAGRLIAARRWNHPTELDTDAGHVLMGLAMSGMLVARLRILPAPAWEAVFTLAAAWYAWQLFQSRRTPAATPWRCPQPAPHLVECAAMLYMFLVLPPLAGRAAAAAMSAMTTSASASRLSALSLVMALFMFGYVVRVADRLRPPAPAPALDLARASPACPPATASLPATACPPIRTRPPGDHHHPSPVPQSPPSARSRWASPWATCWSSRCSPTGPAVD